MPFAKWFLDETQQKASTLFFDSWNDPENPPRVYLQVYRSALLRKGENGVDVTERFDVEFERKDDFVVWTFTAREQVDLTHAATAMGYVYIKPGDKGPDVDRLEAGGKFVVTVPKEQSIRIED